MIKLAINNKLFIKLKMFQSVGSKIAESIKQFKTYHPYKKKEKKLSNDGIDNLINKVQEEIKQKEINNNDQSNTLPVSVPS